VGLTDAAPSGWRPAAVTVAPAARAASVIDVAYQPTDDFRVLGAAGGAHGQMHGDARELGAGGLCAELGLDVALEHPAGGSAAEVAVIDLEDRFEEDATAR
jgi:hypothetical protein